MKIRYGIFLATILGSVMLLVSVVWAGGTGTRCC